MSTAKLSAYLFAIGALPGAFLANASVMFFKHAPAHFWLDGLFVGGLIGVVIAVLIAAADRPAKA